MLLVGQFETFSIGEPQQVVTIVNPADFAVALVICQNFRVDSDSKIRTIKTVRQLRKCGLVDAKHAVEAAMLFLNNNKDGFGNVSYDAVDAALAKFLP